MQPASSARLRDGSMAARRHGAEKPHQGVSTRNRALHRGFSRCKSRNALGLRAVEPKTRVRSFCSGEQWDPDLSLYYLRARYYNPVTGRFLSVDSQAGQGQRRYQYAGADPVNGMDPSGNEAIIEFALINNYPGRLGFIQVHFPAYCGLPGIGGFLPGCVGPPPTPHPPLPPCTGPLCNRYVAVADGNPPTNTIKGMTGRDVNYYIHDLYFQGGHWSYSADTVGSYWVNLQEILLTGSHSGTGICDHPICSMYGVFEDGQSVWDGNDYSISRQWGLSRTEGTFGNSIPVWDPNTKKPASYEILHLKYKANLFAMEYADYD